MITVFEGQMVRLRGRREADAAVFHGADRDAAAVDLDVPYDYRWGTADGDAFLAAQQTKPGETYAFTVESLDDERVLGRVVLWVRPFPHRHGTFGIYLLEGERGRGLGTDTLRTVQQFAFDGLGLHRLGLSVRAQNPARHLYTRLGFQREVIWREDLFIAGAYEDQWVMGLLEDEYRASLAAGEA